MSTLTAPRQLAAAQAELLRRRCEASLRIFVEDCWSIVCPGVTFRPGWHFDLLCEHLEQVTAGEVRRLVVAIPPRYGKSLIVSVCWPAWELLHHPSRRFLCVSYGEDLAAQFSLARRRLIEHPWFQAKWGARVRLCRDQRDKMEFHTRAGGVMLASSIFGAVTGRGGDRVIIDDPHSALTVARDTQRERVIRAFRRMLSTRLNHPREGAIVVVAQRFHVDDLAGFCLRHGYQSLVLPALAPARTVLTFPRSGRIVVREEGEPLWPDHEAAAELETRRQFDPYGFAGQYQQQPAPVSGALFQRGWWHFYDAPPEAFDQVVVSCDAAFKSTSTSSYVVILVAGRRGPTTYLLARFKGRWNFPQTCEVLRTVIRTYHPHAVLVEAAANGQAIVDHLSLEWNMIIAVRPEGNARERGHAANSGRSRVASRWSRLD